MWFDTLAVILSNTPLWAWAVLAVLIAIGVVQLRDRTVNWTRLMVMPVVVLGLAVSGLTSIGVTSPALAGLAGGAVLGAVASIAAERRDRAVQTRRGEVRVRGEWLTLAALLGAFLTRYISIVVGILEPTAIDDAAFQAVAMLATGAFASFTTGRAALRLRVAFQ